MFKPAFVIENGFAYNVDTISISMFVIARIKTTNPADSSLVLCLHFVQSTRDDSLISLEVYRYRRCRTKRIKIHHQIREESPAATG